MDIATMRGLKTTKTIVMGLIGMLLANQSFALGMGGKLVYDRATIRDYDHAKFDMLGVSGTLQLGEFDSLLSPAVHGQYSRGSIDTPTGKTDINYFEGLVTVGGILYKPNDNFILRAFGGVGIGISDLNVQTSTGSSDTNPSFAVLPLGLEANMLVPDTNLSFFGTAMFKHYIDVGDVRSRCNDGSVASKGGFDVCDGKGGFASDSEYPIGKMNGFQFGIGAKLFY